MASQSDPLPNMPKRGGGEKRALWGLWKDRPNSLRNLANRFPYFTQMLTVLVTSLKCWHEIPFLRVVLPRVTNVLWKCLRVQFPERFWAFILWCPVECTRPFPCEYSARFNAELQERRETQSRSTGADNSDSAPQWIAPQAGGRKKARMYARTWRIRTGRTYTRTHTHTHIREGRNHVNVANCDPLATFFFQSFPIISVFQYLYNVHFTPIFLSVSYWRLWNLIFFSLPFLARSGYLQIPQKESNATHFSVSIEGH